MEATDWSGQLLKCCTALETSIGGIACKKAGFWWTPGRFLSMDTSWPLKTMCCVIFGVWLCPCLWVASAFDALPKLQLVARADRCRAPSRSCRHPRPTAHGCWSSPAFQSIYHVAKANCFYFMLQHFRASLVKFLFYWMKLFFTASRTWDFIGLRLTRLISLDVLSFSWLYFSLFSFGILVFLQLFMFFSRSIGIWKRSKLRACQHPCPRGLGAPPPTAKQVINYRLTWSVRHKVNSKKLMS